MNSKIERRVTLLCTLVIFLVLTCIREIFNVRAANKSDALMISIIRQAKNDFYDASYSVLTIFWVIMLLSKNFTLTAPK